MRKLNGMMMVPNQDPDEYLTEVLQLRNQLEYTAQSFTEIRILDLPLEGLSDTYGPIRFAVERNPEGLLKEIKTTIRNMYTNRVAHGSGLTFSRGNGRESAMAASSGFKGSFDYSNKPGHKSSSDSNFCERMVRNHYLHDSAGCRAQQQQRDNVGAGRNTRGNNDHNNGKSHRCGNASNTGRANTTVTANDTSLSPTAIASAPPAPVIALLAPVSSQPAPAPYKAIAPP